MVTMPDDIAADPVQGAVWACIAPEGNGFAEADVPALRHLCFWHAVARQAEQSILRGDGQISIFDKVGVKPFSGPDGRKLGMYRKTPALAVLKEASAEIRALSDMLGLTPSARARMGAAQAPQVETEHGRKLAVVLGDRAEKERKAAGA